MGNGWGRLVGFDIVITAPYKWHLNVVDLVLVNAFSIPTLFTSKCPNWNAVVPEASANCTEIYIYVYMIIT